MKIYQTVNTGYTWLEKILPFLCVFQLVGNKIGKRKRRHFGKTPSPLSLLGPVSSRSVLRLVPEQPKKPCSHSEGEA